MTKELLDIIKKKNFTNFWECFDFLKNASYPEHEALMMSFDLFNNPTDGIIGVNARTLWTEDPRAEGHDEEAIDGTFEDFEGEPVPLEDFEEGDYGDALPVEQEISFSGFTGTLTRLTRLRDTLITARNRVIQNEPVDVPVAYPVIRANGQDDLLVEIYMVSSKGNPLYINLYKAYSNTGRYKEIPFMEEQIKSLSIRLTSELAIRFFNDTFSNGFYIPQNN